MIYFFLLLILSGCNLGPNLREPEISVPYSWKEDQTVEISQPKCFDLWWQIFADDILDDLELTAIEASPNLDVALYRVEQAWAEANISRADLFPQLSLRPQYSSSGQLIRLFQPPNFSLAFPSTPYRAHILNYVLPLNFSYELDLWGRIRNQTEASLFKAEAQESAYHTALLTLTTQVASSYYNLRLLASQKKVAVEEIISREKSLNFYQERYNKGISGLLDVETGKVELANLKATFQEIERQEALESHRLAVLIGRPPAELCLIVDELTHSPPLIPPGVPSTILLNRPDIAEAERLRASENASVGAAWASFFPAFNLTSAIGFISPTTKDFLEWQSRYWQHGATGDQTLFDGFRKSSNYQAAWARFDEADAQYKQTVLQAFAEVEDALASLNYLAQQQVSYNQAFESSEKGLMLSQNRFNKGLVPTIEVIDKQRASLQARLNQVSVLGNSYQATIELIKALGGSWGACAGE